LAGKGALLAGRPEVKKVRKKLGTKEEATKTYEREQKTIKKTIDEILEDSDKIREIYIPELKAKIEYKPLTVEEYFQMKRFNDNEEQMIEILFHMWKKCDPNVTKEKIRKIPLSIMTRIIFNEPSLFLLGPLSRGQTRPQEAKKEEQST